LVGDWQDTLHVKVPVVFYGPEDSKMDKFIFIGTFLMLLIIIAGIEGIAFAV
jgi:hypothetical protein